MLLSAFLFLHPDMVILSVQNYIKFFFENWKTFNSFGGGPSDPPQNTCTYVFHKPWENTGTSVLDLYRVLATIENTDVLCMFWGLYIL